MSTRRGTDALFAGAKGTIRLEQIAKLGRRAVVQPKVDGCLATVLTGGDGAIDHIILRSGESAPADFVSQFRGVRWAPRSVLACEAELWTQAARRAEARRGYPILHILDAQRVGGVDVTREPFHVRRDAIMRTESALVHEDRDVPWTVDQHGAAHDLATGVYVPQVPLNGWRRLVAVEQRPASQAELAWNEWGVERLDDLDGIVVCALDAPLGKRGSKRKCKPRVTLDATVLEVGRGVARLVWAGRMFAVSCRGRALVPGEVVEVAYNGVTDAGIPMHARITRRRPDLYCNSIAGAP